MVQGCLNLALKKWKLVWEARIRSYKSFSGQSWWEFGKKGPANTGKRYLGFGNFARWLRFAGTVSRIMCTIWWRHGRRNHHVGHSTTCTNIGHMFKKRRFWKLQCIKLLDMWTMPKSHASQEESTRDIRACRRLLGSWKRLHELIASLSHQNVRQSCWGKLVCSFYCKSYTRNPKVSLAKRSLIITDTKRKGRQDRRKYCAAAWALATLRIILQIREEKASK